MAKTTSSKHWLKEHFDDIWVRKAQDAGYRSRAAFKLLEINQKDRLLKPGTVVVDLGAAPGGWSQIAEPLVKPGGFLVTSSCTNLVKPELFLQIIDMAARDARRKIRQVVFNAQSSDHPIIWHMENTNYLKFLIVQVL